MPLHHYMSDTGYCWFQLDDTPCFKQTVFPVIVCECIVQRYLCENGQTERLALLCPDFSTFLNYLIPAKFLGPMYNLSDRELWEAFEAGDKSAYGLLFKRYKEKLFYYCYQQLKNAEEAKEMVNEIFYRILKEGKRPAEGYDSLEGWFIAFARFFCKALNRKELNRERIRTNVARNTRKSENLNAGLDVDKIEAAISRLPNKDYQYIIRLTAQGYSNPEIAEKMGKEEGWVRRRKSDARKSLKQILEKGGLFS